MVSRMIQFLRQKIRSQGNEQLEKLRYPVVQEFVDIHCHCLPNFDDGPKTKADSLALCRTLVFDGITSVIATPHQLGSYDGRNPADTVRRAVSALSRELEANRIPLKVYPGADVRVDERIPDYLNEDLILTLADTGRYLLLELPHDSIVEMEPLLQELTTMSITTIISHPERNEYLIRHPDAVLPWLKLNAHLQLTAGSFLGVFGPAAEEMAWHFLTSGKASVIASDAHDLTTRCPRMLEAFYTISEQLSEEAARTFCLDNPRAVLAGKEIIRPELFV